MKTTPRIDDAAMAQFRREAARQQRTMSELVEAALRLSFRSPKEAVALLAPPTFASGGTLVDIADRDTLYRVMEGQ